MGDNLRYLLVLELLDGDYVLERGNLSDKEADIMRDQLLKHWPRRTYHKIPYTPQTWHQVMAHHGIR